MKINKLITFILVISAIAELILISLLVNNIYIINTENENLKKMVLELSSALSNLDMEKNSNNQTVEEISNFGVKGYEYELGRITVLFDNLTEVKFSYPLQMGEATIDKKYGVVHFSASNISIFFNWVGRGMGFVPEGTIESSLSFSTKTGQILEIHKMVEPNGIVTYFWGWTESQVPSYPRIDFGAQTTVENTKVIADIESNLKAIVESIEIKVGI